MAGAMPPCNHVYPLSFKETQAKNEYVMEALKQGYICPSTSPASVGFFFVTSGTVSLPNTLSPHPRRRWVENGFQHQLWPLSCCIMYGLQCLINFSLQDMFGMLILTSINDLFIYSSSWEERHSCQEGSCMTLEVPAICKREEIWVLCYHNITFQLHHQSTGCSHGLG